MAEASSAASVVDGSPCIIPMASVRSTGAVQEQRSHLGGRDLVGERERPRPPYDRVLQVHPRGPELLFLAELGVDDAVGGRVVGQSGGLQQRRGLGCARGGGVRRQLERHALGADPDFGQPREDGSRDQQRETADERGDRRGLAPQHERRRAPADQCEEPEDADRDLDERTGNARPSAAACARPGRLTIHVLAHGLDNERPMHRDTRVSGLCSAARIRT